MKRGKQKQKSRQLLTFRIGFNLNKNYICEHIYQHVVSMLYKLFICNIGTVDINRNLIVKIGQTQKSAKFINLAVTRLSCAVHHCAIN